MRGCGYLPAILLGFALTGCSPEVPETQVSSGQFIGGNSGEIAGGFVQSDVDGSGGFGGATPQWDTILEGEIDGDYVLQLSGKRISSNTGKGPMPVVVKFQSERLPLMPFTDEIGEQLLKLSGSRVRLKGQMRQALSKGGGYFGGQQGLGDGCPDHVVHFLMVDTVEPL